MNDAEENNHRVSYYIFFFFFFNAMIETTTLLNINVSKYHTSTVPESNLFQLQCQWVYCAWISEEKPNKVSSYQCGVCVMWTLKNYNSFLFIFENCFSFSCPALLCHSIVRSYLMFWFDLIPHCNRNHLAVLIAISKNYSIWNGLLDSQFCRVMDVI